MNAFDMPIGANRLPDGRIRFRVWAPHCRAMDVAILRGRRRTALPLQRESGGYFSCEVAGIRDGDRYMYVLENARRRPDPASRHQPDGVHEASAFVDPERFGWTDGAWRGIAFDDLIFYELHVGTFTREGTFDAAIRRIPYLASLGVTCVELMPVAQFEGRRNWGYDGVDLFAVQNSYGGPDGLKRFVNACHRAGLAVALDVVYNHFGPSGNYLAEFGPYTTSRYTTPWGEAVNFDDAGCDGVREFVIANACHWIVEYHVDVLRLDAVHGIVDQGPLHILAAIKQAAAAVARKRGVPAYVVAESDLNDPRLLRRPLQGGYGLDGQWSDDFHHAVHAVLTREQQGYYADFGRLKHVAKALRNGFVYDGRFSRHRRRRHGAPLGDIAPGRLVVCTQNHDQVGNRALGERLGALVAPERERLAAFLLLLAPNTPLLFMGQEYGERAPFQYFVDFQDADLREAVRQGRRREFAAFGWTTVADPCAAQTFRRSKLDWRRSERQPEQAMLALYRGLIRFRKENIAGGTLTDIVLDERQKYIAYRYRSKKGRRLGLIASFASRELALDRPFAGRSMRKLLATGESRVDERSVRLAPFTGLMVELS
jgi:maltooligosyltrehalose trehalohydrolase